jgi:hypothetical protein
MSRTTPRPYEFTVGEQEFKQERLSNRERMKMVPKLGGVIARMQQGGDKESPDTGAAMMALMDAAGTLPDLLEIFVQKGQAKFSFDPALDPAWTKLVVCEEMVLGSGCEDPFMTYKYLYEVVTREFGAFLAPLIGGPVPSLQELTGKFIAYQSGS